MITYGTEIQILKRKIPESITCDICKKKYYYGNDDMEIQEFHYINFRGGYESVFGDDVLMKGDICQHCLKEKLGEFLSVDEEEN